HLLSPTFFFLECYPHHPDLHSFPTRRSSDLENRLAHGFTSTSPPSPPLRDSGPATPGRTDSSPSTAARAVTTPSMWSSAPRRPPDRKSTRLNSSHVAISYAVFCLKKKKPP